MSNQCEVLQSGKVIATANGYLAAKDIADAMQAAYPNLRFGWRWEE
jgi:hypothetical protein